MSIPYFDAHCDTLSAILRGGRALRENDFHLDLARLGRYAPAAQVFALFTRPKDMLYKEDYTKDASPEALGKVYDELLDFALRAFAENSDVLTLCRSASEAREAWEAGRIAAFLAVEGAELIGCSEEKLAQAYEKGVRLVNLTWNYANALSGTNQTLGGLTDAGKHFIRTAQEMGVAVDLCYAAATGLLDADDRDTVLSALAQGGMLDGIRHSASFFAQTEELMRGLDAWALSTGSAALTMPVALGKSKTVEMPDREAYAKVFKEILSLPPRA